MNDVVVGDAKQRLSTKILDGIDHVVVMDAHVKLSFKHIS